MPDRAARAEAEPPATEIEVTPEMIEAGLLDFFAGDTELEPSEDIVACIYRVMRLKCLDR